MVIFYCQAKVTKLCFLMHGHLLDAIIVALTEKSSYKSDTFLVYVSIDQFYDSLSLHERNTWFSIIDDVVSF